MREMAPFLCFIVVAFSGVYLGVSNRRGAPIPAANSSPLAAAAAAGDGKPEADASGQQPPAVRLLRDFYAVPIRDHAEATSSPLSALHGDLAARGLAQSVRFLIVTLADPIESSADHFDPFLDALQRAFEAEGMVIDRHYLPWKEALDGRGRGKSGEPIYRDEPGVVLFREIPPPPGGAGIEPMKPPRVVAVLIVGENPISGIHKRAFGEALDILAQWWSAEPPAPSSSPLRIPILGPTYSGSAASLRLALEDWMERQCQHTVVEFLSGSAMAQNNKRYLEFAVPTNPHGAALLSNFHATILSSKELQEVFFREFLAKRLHAQLDQVVMLTEANTAYGASAARSVLRISGAMQVTYPAQIGRTRTAYERQNLLQLPVGPGGGLRPIGGVEIRLEENPRATDLPPAFSPAMAAHIERIVMTLLDAINRENRQYVGLVGTSVEDRLFLAQLIYYRCPNVRLFCLDNNLLYTHPRYNRYLEGMLVASPFPLYPRHYEGQQTPLSSFSSDEANGTYIACRVAISRVLGAGPRAGLVSEYAAPFSSHEPDEAVPLRPPVWVVQVGRNRILPLAMLEPPPLETPHARDDYTLRLDRLWQAQRIAGLNEQAQRAGLGAGALDTANLPARDEQPQELHMHGPSALLRGFVGCFSLLVLLMLGRAALTARPPRGARRRITQLATPLETSYRAQLRIEWCWLASLLVATQLMLAAPILIAAWFDWHLTPVDGLTILTGVLSAVTLITAAGIGLREHFRPAYAEVHSFRAARLAIRRQAAAATGPRRGTMAALRQALAWLEAQWEAWAAPVIGLVLPALAVGLFTWYLVNPLHESDRFFLAEQLISPTSRVSPFVPLWTLLLGFVFLFGTRAMRLSRSLGEAGSRSRMALFAPWRAAQPAAGPQRDAARAIDAVESQSAVIDYWLAKVLRPAIVIVLAVSFLFPRVRLTTQPTAIEWSLRLGLLGLALAATCLIGSGLECLRALERFWRHFSAPEWTAAWGSVTASLRESLKLRLFAALPEGYAPSDRPAEAHRVRQLARQFVAAIQRLQPDLTPAQQQALLSIRQLAADQAAENPVDVSLQMLSLLQPLDVSDFPPLAEVRAAQQTLRERLAPLIAEFSLFVLSQLCRRLIGAIILTLIFMLALESYPFQPHRFLVVLQLCLVGTAVGAAVWAYLAVNKSATLSAIVGDHAGLTFDTRLLYESLVFLGVPVLTVLSLHFPDLSEFFGTAADAVKGVKL